jgi:hypothetical protein
MADKDDTDTRKHKGGVGLTGRLLGTLAAMGAAFFARKLITFAWTRATGKKPPVHPEDPQVGLGEALTWAILTGVGVEAARLIATRAMTRRLDHNEDEAPVVVD